LQDLAMRRSAGTRRVGRWPSDLFSLETYAKGRCEAALSFCVATSRCSSSHAAGGRRFPQRWHTPDHKVDRNGRRPFVLCRYDRTRTTSAALIALVAEDALILDAQAEVARYLSKEFEAAELVDRLKHGGRMASAVNP
jgi:hypothetical protein